MSNLKTNDSFPDNIVFYPEAAEDFSHLDKRRKIMVIKALQKISRAPDQFGKSLENQPNRPLAGFRSIYVDNKAVRIIWTVVKPDKIQVAIVAGIAEKNNLLVYTLAAARKKGIDEFIEKMI